MNVKSESVSSSIVSDTATPRTVACQASLSPWDFPGKTTGVGWHSLLQRIFPTQGSNLALPHCRQTLYHLSHQGSMFIGKQLLKGIREKQQQQIIMDFPGGSDGKASACNAGDPGSTPGLGRSPGEGKCYPLQYLCLENPMDRGAW